MDWLAIAKGLPYGQKIKVECCAGDRSCIVSHDTKGYRAWCFRCDPQDPPRFKPHGLRSVAELSAIRTAQDALLATNVVSLPPDATTQLGPMSLKWLLLAGISADLWSHYGFMESPLLNRVCLPMRTMGKLNAVLLRSLSKDVKPKYLLRTENPNEPTVFRSSLDTLLPSAEAAETVHAFDTVITEDALSAIRVGRHTRTAALLGTAVDAHRLSAIVPALASSTAVEWYRSENRVLRIGVWLDPDKAGRKASHRLLASLKLQGYEVADIRTEKDPKFYSDRDIRSILIARHSSS